MHPPLTGRRAVPPRLSPQGLLVGAMIGAAAANLVQYPSIERDIGRIYDAVSVYDDKGMAQVALVHSRGVPERFGLPLQIGTLAPRARIVLGGVDLGLLEELYGLGRAEAVVDGEPLPSPPRLDRISGEAAVLVSGEDRDRGPYTIAVGATPEELRVHRAVDRLWVIDAALLGLPNAEADG